MNTYLDLTTLPLHEILLANGWRIDKNKSSANHPALINENGTRLIVSKKGENYLYFNAQDDEDRGNIISFAKHRGINIKELISNYDSSIELSTNKDYQFFKTQNLSSSYYASEYLKFQDCDIQNNLLLKRRGFDLDVLSAYQGILKQDSYGNLVIPHYKLETITGVNKQEQEIVMICGYTKRLNLPLLNHKDGTPRDKPLKNIHYGNKGFETLAIQTKDSSKIDNLVISESIFDALAYMQLKRLEPKSTLLLSTAGNFNLQEQEKTLSYILDKIKHTQNLLAENIHIAFDNDINGRDYANKIYRFIIQKRNQIPINKKPFTKDFNDDLKLANITNVDSINEEKYNKWVDKAIYEFYRHGNKTNPKLLHDIKKANDLKPFQQKQKEKFNSMYKHKAIKNIR